LKDLLLRVPAGGERGDDGESLKRELKAEVLVVDLSVPYGWESLKRELKGLDGWFQIALIAKGRGGIS